MTRKKKPRSLYVGNNMVASTRRTPEKNIPYLRLQGKWLQDCGFCCGDVVTVIQGDRCLTILNNSLLEDQEPRVE
ncbi:MAG: hypothetical protein QM743_10195 [Chitinophagaceae bacterium]